MNYDARFYFANLGSDILRCIRADAMGNSARYEQSLERARRTLAFLRTAGRPEAYEEGLLLLRAFDYARQNADVPQYEKHLMQLMAAYAPKL